MKRLFRQFSFPGGIPSHVAPETPGSIHEGGELGYATAGASGCSDARRWTTHDVDRMRTLPAGVGEASVGDQETLNSVTIPRSKCSEILQSKM